MIRKIRRKFILIAVTVLSVTMLALGAVINVSNWMIVRGEMRETLETLAENSGAQQAGFGRKTRTRRMQNTLDESRYFLVSLPARGSILITDSSHAGGTSEEDLSALVSQALTSGRETGIAGNYMYLIRKAGGAGGSTAVFLNVETRMDRLRRLLIISALACAGGILAAWLLVSLFSEKAIQPLIRNAVQQKQFITDAGHELKTPLAVISANMDALELETEKNEWISGTREQVSRMGGLVNEMIYLSRLDEDGASLSMDTLNLEALLRDTAEPFQAMAEFKGKSLEVQTEGKLLLRGNAEALQKLISQLCDNAVKYAPEGDRILIRASRRGHFIRLTEENGLAAPMAEETLSHLFDRFYRPDASRSREKGGNGIGLSMARAVAEKHGGSLQAELKAEDRLLFVCELPAEKDR